MNTPSMSNLNIPAIDVQCQSCKRIWYATGIEEAPIASRSMRVRMLKMPEVGDKVMDVLKPIE